MGSRGYAGGEIFKRECVTLLASACKSLSLKGVVRFFFTENGGAVARGQQDWKGARQVLDFVR